MRVRVQNYQTIKDVTVDINGFTVIVGKSNTGKTALLRATEGAIFNDTVTGRVRHGEKYIVVDIQYNGTSWTWKKGDTYNDYDVRTASGLKEYSKVGFDFPQEVKDAGFREYLIDSKKTRPQVAAWHEPIFLLNKTGRVVTELITTVTRLDVVNLAIRKCSTYLRRMRSELKVREADLQKAQHRSKDFDALDGMDVTGLEAAYEAHQETHRKIGEIDAYRTRLDNFGERLELYKVLDKVKMPKAMPTDGPRDIERLDGWLTRHSDLTETVDNLAVLDGLVIPEDDLGGDLSTLTNLTTWDSNLTAMRDRRIAMEDLEFLEIPEVDLQTTVDELDQVKGYLARMLKDGKELKQAKRDLEELETSLEADEHTLHELRGTIDDCPVCGRV